jgi:thrombospondin 2/3/4/5
VFFANRPRRKFRISIEALFMIDFPTTKNKFSFYLDRKSKRGKSHMILYGLRILTFSDIPTVTIDINSQARIFSKNLEIPELNETSTIRSLAISFQQNAITLYIDCKETTKKEIEINLSKLYSDMEEPTVKLFRERKYPLHFDTTPQHALARASCEKQTKRKGNNKFLKDSEGSRKKSYNEGEGLLTYIECECFLQELLLHLFY